jgi:3' terminal RNA ribose 2'-O-methyltransferase Hen1
MGSEEPADRAYGGAMARKQRKRHGAVFAALRSSGAESVLDLGCGSGTLLRELAKDKQFRQIVGMDVSIRSLEAAQSRLKLDRLPDKQAERIKLIHGSLIYRDKRLANFDAAAVVEVMEHLDPPRLASLERVLFEFARPKMVVMTTPNREYNVTWETLGRSVPPSRSSVRVDSAGIPTMGCQSSPAAWLRRAVPDGRAGR